jgi:RNA polymerase sigma-70 factor (ECF subfamily)
MGDPALLDRLRRGDEGAFDSIFRTWYPPLVRMAEAMLRRRAIAEEIVQDVMLEMWRRRERLAPDSSLRAYLFQATRNRALNHLRHLRVEERDAASMAAPSSMGPPADAALVEEEIAMAIRNAMNSLPQRCREVFRLSRMHGLTYSEIAQTLGVTVKAVEAQMGRALRTMREALAPWLPSGDTL